jgi:Plasmid pRiA4b ORF-3-like protein
VRPAAPIYQLKPMVRHVAPPIWRRVQVSGAITLAALHGIIQTVMGWDDYHLWAFTIDKDEYLPPVAQDPFMAFDVGAARRPLSAKSAVLDELVAGRRIKFSYNYDFGDDWWLDIKVERVLTPELGVIYPRCLDGQRAGPPEDCGGVPGFFNLLDALADPGHPEREELIEWTGGEWDAEAFDLDAMNAALKPRSRRPRKPKAAPG